MDAIGSMLDDLDSALASTTVDPRDQATVTLARTLAWTIDNDPDQLEKLATKLLACLSALGLTVTSRKETKPASDGDESEQAFAAVLQLVPADSA